MKKIFKFIICFPFFFFINPFTIFICKTISTYFLNISFRSKLKKCGKNVLISKNSKFYGLNNVEIGDAFYSADGLWLSAICKYQNNDDVYNPKIIIGNNVNISRYCHICAINEIVIEDNVLIGSNVLVIDNSHGNSFDYSKSRNNLSLVSKGNIKIGANTWICDNSVILANVTIGKNCIIAANSVVNKSFPDNCVIGGTPARIISMKD